MSKNHSKIYTKPQNIGECSKWSDLALLETWARYWHKGHVERHKNSLQVKPRLKGLPSPATPTSLTAPNSFNLGQYKIEKLFPIPPKQWWRREGAETRHFGIIEMGGGVVQGYLPFTRENRKFQLENQMVRAIPFGKLQKIWAVIWDDAIFLLFEVSLADVNIFHSDSLSRNLAFNCVMFMPEISNRMVFVNGKHPGCSIYFVQDCSSFTTPKRRETWKGLPLSLVFTTA